MKASILFYDNVLKITWSHPVKTGGSKVTKYKIEWDTDKDFKNVLTSGYTHEFVDVGMGITSDYTVSSTDPYKIRYFYKQKFPDKEDRI